MKSLTLRCLRDFVIAWLSVAFIVPAIHAQGSSAASYQIDQILTLTSTDGRLPPEGGEVRFRAPPARAHHQWPS